MAVNTTHWTPLEKKDHTFYSAIEHSISNSISISDEDVLQYTQSVESIHGIYASDESHGSSDNLVPIGTETETNTQFSLFGQIVTKCVNGDIGIATGFVAMDKSGGMQAIITCASIFFKKGTNNLIDSAKFYLQRIGTNKYVIGTEIIKLYIHPKFDPLSSQTGFDICIIVLPRVHFEKVLELAPSPEVASWGGTNPETMTGLKLQLVGYPCDSMYTVNTVCVRRDLYVNGGCTVAYEDIRLPPGFMGGPLSLTLSLPGDRKRRMVCGVHTVGNIGTLFTPDLYEWILARLRVANMKS